MTERERLLLDTLVPAAGEDFARAAAALARRRRRSRGRVASASVAMAVLAAGIVLKRPPTAPPPLAMVSSGPPRLEFITDDELVAELADQPVLFVRDRAGIVAVVFAGERGDGAEF